MTGQPTSRDVAAAAGVARSTVSYVLNETAGVQISDATRARVLSAAAELGYLGNAAAADLRRGGSRVVFAAVAEGRKGELMSNLLNLVSQQLRPAGYPLLAGLVDTEVRTADVRSWAALRPAVILCIGVGLSPEQQELLRTAQIPVIGGVAVAQPLDQAGFARTAARALLERGRRSLLHVMPADPALDALARPREAPFAAEVASVADAALWGTRRMALTEDAAAALVDEVLAAPAAPDAIFAFNDEHAALLLGALLDRGVDVPGRIALLGSDNLSWTRYLRPALSSISYNIAAVAAQLTSFVTATATRGAPPPMIALDAPHLVIHRQTT